MTCGKVGKEIVLTEAFLYTCMNCGGYMESESPYDYYCCDKCKKEGDIFVEGLAKEYIEALKFEENPAPQTRQV